MYKKMLWPHRICRVFISILMTLGLNCYSYFSWLNKTDSIRLGKLFLSIFITTIFFLVVNFWPLFRKLPTKTFRSMAKGNELLKIFLLTSIFSVAWEIFYAIWLFTDISSSNVSHFNIWVIKWIVQIMLAILFAAILFWHGMIRIYLTSLQLGIKHRVLALLLGWVPIANIYYLCKMISVVDCELITETEKYELNEARSAQAICATKYPILLVHGVFFRDFKNLNYWGRIPDELQKNGATFYYGNQQSALSVADSAAELANRIKEMAHETGCEKFNVIAHSKGGLDIRYALANLDIAPYVASVTTINTPHRGCGFADYLLDKIPLAQQNIIAGAYNAALKKFGETPDFIAAVKDLTASKCIADFDPLPLPAGIYSASVGSNLKNASGGKFPMNFSYLLVKYFDGPNDGLVSATSFAWGEKYTYLEPTGKRGISHGDVIDLNRENIQGFDVREFYVQMVADLKNKGL